MNYSELLNYLFLNGDKKFAEFSKTLSNSDYITIGVKNPVLRKLIKEHKGDEELNLIDFKLGKYLEVDFIYFGLALIRAKTLQEQLSFMGREIQKAKSWVITDCSQTYLKKSSFEQFLDFFKKHHNSKAIYERRFCYVFGLKHSKSPRIPEIFSFFTFNEDYMVMMAEAWLLATIAINFSDEVLSFLSVIKDKVLIRKTVSKICESFRISDGEKTRFKTLRKAI